tara:strand:- start:85 stop:507 length:423 start_codon:yes stop_codon:yes gene_type:complete
MRKLQDMKKIRLMSNIASVGIVALASFGIGYSVSYYNNFQETKLLASDVQKSLVATFNHTEKLEADIRQKQIVIEALEESLIDLCSEESEDSIKNCRNTITYLEQDLEHRDFSNTEDYISHLVDKNNRSSFFNKMKEGEI